MPLAPLPAEIFVTGQYETRLRLPGRVKCISVAKGHNLQSDLSALMTIIRRVQMVADQHRRKQPQNWSDRVTWILRKQKRTFFEQQKECILAPPKEVVMDNWVRDQVISCTKSIPMSDAKTGRRVDILPTDVFEMLLAKLKKVEVLSPDVDKYTVNFDKTQLFYGLFHWWLLQRGRSWVNTSGKT